MKLDEGEGVVLLKLLLKIEDVGRRKDTMCMPFFKIDLLDVYNIYFSVICAPTKIMRISTFSTTVGLANHPSMNY